MHIFYDPKNYVILFKLLLQTELTEAFCINLFSELDNAINNNNNKIINDIIEGINYRLKYYKINSIISYNTKSKL